MGEPSLQVTQAGLGQSQQGNLLTSGGSAAASGSRSSQGLAPGRAHWISGRRGAAQHPNSCLPAAAMATPATGPSTEHVQPHCPTHVFKYYYTNTKSTDVAAWKAAKALLPTTTDGKVTGLPVVY